MASIDLVQSILASIPGSQLVADGRQILCRCQICGDSPNPSSAHFYIGPLKDESKPLQFDCKKCGASGLLDGEALRTIGIYDYDLAVMIKEYNDAMLVNSGGRYNFSKSIYRLTNTITDSPLSQAKLKYVNQRLGTNFTYQDCIDNKIVLNIHDLLQANGITELTRYPDIVDQLNMYFIGFISYDNCFLNMRRLCSEGKVYKTIDKRYINYNIFDKIDNSMRFYVIPSQINVLEPRPIHVYITEGPFDILSVKYNIAKMDNEVYISVGGKSYLTAIKFVIGYLGIINAVIHLCPDGDVSDWEMIKIANYLEPFNRPIEMLRNGVIGEKDFGVPPINIEVVTTSLN